VDEEIEQVIREYWERELPLVHDREIILSLEKKFINDVVGPRRAGKTYLMFLTIKKLREQLDKEAIIYINFENRKLLPLKESYFHSIIEFVYAEELLKKYDPVYIFLDEVQRIQGWERYVRSIDDEFKGKIKVFVSGSSANLLSKEYSTLLTGRHLTTTVFPLSFQEFLRFKGVFLKDKIVTEQKKVEMEKHLKEYVQFGGFPDVVLGHEKEAILSQLFTDIVSRDVLSRTAIRKQNLVEEFSYYLASNVSNLLSFNKMKQYFNSRGLKISVPTLLSYFWHLKNAFLFFDSLIFSYTVKDQLQYPRKIYCVDTGIAHIAGFRMSEDYGRLVENIVAVELLRRGFDLYYWKSRQQEEVDFVLKKGTQVNNCIQVCYEIKTVDTKQRELKALLKAMDTFQIRDGVIITGTLEEQHQIDNKTIHFYPLWKWLLGLT